VTSSMMMRRTRTTSKKALCGASCAARDSLIGPGIFPPPIDVSNFSLRSSDTMGSKSKDSDILACAKVLRIARKTCSSFARGRVSRPNASATNILELKSLSGPRFSKSRLVKSASVLGKRLTMSFWRCASTIYTAIIAVCRSSLSKSVSMILLISGRLGRCRHNSRNAFFATVSLSAIWNHSGTRAMALPRSGMCAWPSGIGTALESQ